MPSNLINKVVVGNEVVLDLDSDTLSSADQIPDGVTAHLNTGEAVEGTAEIKETTTYNIETRDETIAIEGEGGGSAYIPAGESINIGISAAERAKIIPDNIAENIVILGVTGTHSGGGGSNSEHPNPNNTSIMGGVGTQTASATSYTIDPSVTKLSDYAFYKRENLKSVTMPSGLDTIGQYAFSQTGIENTDFLSSITGNYSVLTNGFSNCPNLTDVNAPHLYVAQSSAFANNTALETVNLPDVYQIQGLTFSGDTALTSVTFGDSLQSIYSGNIIANCINLHELTIPSGVTTFPVQVFMQSGLTNFYAPGVTKYNNYMLSQDVYITEYTHSASMPNAAAGTATYVFNGCTQLRTADLTGLAIGSTTTVAQNASWFASCSNLQTVNMPNLVALPNNFFSGCTNLDDTYMPNGSQINVSTTKYPVFASGGEFCQAAIYSTSRIRLYKGTASTVVATLQSSAPTYTMTLGGTDYTFTWIANGKMTVSW